MTKDIFILEKNPMVHSIQTFFDENNFELIDILSWERRGSCRFSEERSCYKFNDLDNRTTPTDNLTRPRKHKESSKRKTRILWKDWSPSPLVCVCQWQYDSDDSHLD